MWSGSPITICPTSSDFTISAIRNRAAASPLCVAIVSSGWASRPVGSLIATPIRASP
jgi:hypothetical protein